MSEGVQLQMLEIMRNSLHIIDSSYADKKVEANPADFIPVICLLACEKFTKYLLLSSYLSPLTFSVSPLTPLQLVLHSLTKTYNLNDIGNH